MNHQYIDYMINERRQMEIEECERRRLLKAAGYENFGLTRSVVSRLIEAFRTVLSRPGIRRRNFPVHVPVVQTATHKNGEGI